MISFRTAVTKHALASKRLEVAESTRKASEKKARADAVAQRLAPFQAAASKLEALMKDDPDFKKFVEKRVATVKTRGGATYRWIASTTFGKHDTQTGWRFEMTPTYSEVDTGWHLAVDLKEDKVEIEIHSNDPSAYTSPADVPKQVWCAFQPVLQTLQDKKKVYGFLLKEFGP